MKDALISIRSGECGFGFWNVFVIGKEVLNDVERRRLILEEMKEMMKESCYDCYWTLNVC